MVRKLVLIIFSLSSFFIIALFAIFLLLATGIGGRWLIQQAVAYAPGELTIGRIQGSLLFGINLYDIDQRIDKQHIKIQHANFNLQPESLLFGKVLIENLKISGVNHTIRDIKVVTTRNTIQSHKNSFFPFPVFIEKARLDHIIFYHGNVQYLLGNINMTGQINKKGFFLKRLEANGEKVHLDIKKAQIDFHPPYPFEAIVIWNSYPLNKVRTKGMFDIRGDAEIVKFRYKLNEPLELKGKGEFKINRKATANGQADLFEMIVKGDLIKPGLPKAHIETNIRTDFTAFYFDQIVVQILGGVLKAGGHIVIQPEPKGEFIVDAVDINPGLQWRGWPGKLALNTRVQGRIDAGEPVIVFDEVKVTGSLLAEPFKADGNFAIVGEKMTIDAFRVYSGKNHLNFSGAISEDLDLRFTLNTPDPIKLWPGIRGNFLTTGVLKGARNSPTGEIKLQGNNINYGNYTIQNVDADFILDTENSQNSKGRYRLSGLKVSDKVFSDLSLVWSGDFKQHKINFDFTSTSLDGSMKIIGSCRKDGCTFMLEKASLSTKEHGKWNLIDSVNFSLSPSEIKPFNACWEQTELTSCTQVSWNEKSGWSSANNSNDLPLKDLIDLIQEACKKEHLGWEKSAY